MREFRKCTLLFAILALSALAGASPPSSLTFAGLFSDFGPKIEAWKDIVRFAVDMVNENTTLLPSTELKVAFYAAESKPSVGAQQAFQAVKSGLCAATGEDDAFGIVGAAFSTISIASSYIFMNAGVPQVSFASTSPQLSEKGNYPFFVRTVPPDSAQSAMISKFFYELGWRKVAAIHTDDEYGKLGADEFERTFLAQNTTQILSTASFPHLPAVSDIDFALNQIVRSNARLVFLNVLPDDCGPFFEGIYRSKQSELLAGKGGLTWVSTDGCASAFSEAKKYDPKNTNELNPFSGFIAFKPLPGDGAYFDTTMSEWDTWCNVSTKCSEEARALPNMGAYGTYTYDSVLVLAHAAHTEIEAGRDVLNRTRGSDGSTNLMNAVRSVSFTGITGTVSFKGNDRASALYEVVNWIDTGSGLKEVSLGSYSTESTKNPADFGIVFPDGTEDPTDRDVPESRFYRVSRIKFATCVKEGSRYVAQFTYDTCTIEEDGELGCGQYLEPPPKLQTGQSCAFVPVDSMIGLFCVALSAAGALISLIVLIWLFVNTKTPVVMYSQPLFCKMHVCGALTICLCGMTFLGENNRTNCLLRPVLINLAFTLTFASIFMKVYRVQRIFTNKKLKVIKITNETMLKMVAAIEAGIAIILTLWMLINPPEPTAAVVPAGNYESNDGGYVQIVCQADDDTFPWSTIAGAYQACLCVFGCYEAYLARRVKSVFSDTKAVGLAIYNVTVIGSITVLLVFIFDTDEDMAALLINIGLFICVVFAEIVIFGPKFLKRHATLADLKAMAASTNTSTNVTVPKSESSTGGSRNPSEIELQTRLSESEQAVMALEDNIKRLSARLNQKEAELSQLQLQRRSEELGTYFKKDVPQKTASPKQVKLATNPSFDSEADLALKDGTIKA